MKIAAALLPVALVACGNANGIGTNSGGASGTSSGASSSGTSSSTSSSGSSFTLGAAITAPAETWTWVPFSDAFCGNGTATGLGVNLNPNSDQVIIYLQGGGACFSSLSCYTLMSAANFTTGYGETNFNADATDPTALALDGGFFDRTASANPFQSYNYVFIPYCTGDVYAGNAVVSLGGPQDAYFVGYANMNAYLERIVATFPNAKQVVLAGSSAGGLGALFNLWRTQQAFGSIPVTLIDDSGTMVQGDVLDGGITDIDSAAVLWNVQATLPSACTDCTPYELDSLYAFNAKSFPNQRGGLISYTDDTVLPAYYGISEQTFATALQGELTTNFDPYSNLGYFVVSGMGHVLWFNPQIAVNGVTLQTWVSQLVSGSSSWKSQQ